MSFKRVLHITAAASCIVNQAGATVFYAKDEALQLAFPMADSVEPVDVFLSAKHLARLKAIDGTKPESKLQRWYVGSKDGVTLGYAYIDSHVVRTLPETIMTVIKPNGEVAAVHVLSFHEPKEYLAPAKWLQQFSKTRMGRADRRSHSVAALAGSTITSQAVTMGVRKAQDLFKAVWMQPGA